MQDVEVSAECLDILTRVLVAQPSERMTMDEIKTHPWFLKGLPPGALEMNDFLLQGLANQEEVSCWSFWQEPRDCSADMLRPACKGSVIEPADVLLRCRMTQVL